MTDRDLDDIRRARLAQLQQQQQGVGAVSDKALTAEDREQQEDEARNSILSQIITPEAADRLGRIRLVKKSRAVDVENRLLMLARSGQLQARVDEKQLKELLSAMAETNVGESANSTGKVVISRRKTTWEDEDDDF